MKRVISLIICLMLCGCGVEPEDRSFVTAVSIEEGYKLSVLTAEGSVESDTNEKNESVIAGEGKSISEAVESCDIKSSGQLFFGHTVLCVADIALLEDRSAVEDMTAFMEENTQISRRVIILAADNPVNILSGTGDGKDVADFVSEHYKSHKNSSAVELDKLCRALAEGGDIVFPIIKGDGSSFEISGGVLLADGVFKQRLSQEDMECISWLVNDGTKTRITLNLDGKGINADISDKYVRVTPEMIKIRVRINTDNDDNRQRVMALCLNHIQKQAEKGLEILQSNGCDIIGMRHAFEKRGREAEFDRTVFRDMDIGLAVE